MSARDEFVLVADGIGKSFGGTAVLTAASLRVRPGLVTAVVGRNGVGKTTLFRIVAGTLRAEYGRVLFRGRHHPRPRLHALARRGLMYSSQASALTGLFRVRDHLSAFARLHGRSEADVAAVVEETRLAEFLDRRPARLSGGEKQRTSLALALLRSPACLLADEPFAGVAPADRPIVAAALRELAKGGCGVVVSGHDVEDLFAVSDRVVWMTAGTTHELGDPASAREHFQFRREYLGPGRLTSPSG